MASSREECAICLDEFSVPKILPCIHTFCLKCLDNYIGKNAKKGHFNCPICRAATKVPKGRASEFQTNFYLSTNDEHLNKEVTRHCEMCKKQMQWRINCKACQKCFCVRCCMVHLQDKKFVRHVLECTVDIKEPLTETICEKHAGKKLSLYCSVCEERICITCTKTEHNRHKCEPLETKAIRIFEDVQDFFKNIKTGHPKLFGVRNTNGSAENETISTSRRKRPNVKKNALKLIKQTDRCISMSTDLIPCFGEFHVPSSTFRIIGNPNFCRRSFWILKNVENPHMPEEMKELCWVEGNNIIHFMTGLFLDIADDTMGGLFIAYIDGRVSKGVVNGQQPLRGQTTEFTLKTEPISIAYRVETDDLVVGQLNPCSVACYRRDGNIRWETTISGLPIKVIVPFKENIFVIVKGLDHLTERLFESSFVLVLNNYGEIKGQYSGHAGELFFPIDMCCSGNSVIVTDLNSKKYIHMLDNNGNFMNMVKLNWFSRGSVAPSCITASGNGYVYVQFHKTVKEYIAVDLPFLIVIVGVFVMVIYKIFLP